MHGRNPTREAIRTLIPFFPRLVKDARNLEKSMIHIAIVLACLTLASPGEYDIKDFGAKGDSRTNDRAAIQSAIDACHTAGGGEVVVPPGTYRTGTVVMRSRVTLRLANGATLLASKENADYTPAAKGRHFSLITADDVENIAIVGQGVLNGQATDEGSTGPVVVPDPLVRRDTIQIFRCKQVTLRDFTVLDSDLYAMEINNCDGALVDGITVRSNPLRPNSDGIVCPGSSNVRIANCHVATGDSGISVKRAADNVVVANCIVQSSTIGLKLGTESSSDIRHVHFSNITVKAPVGIGFYMRDGGSMEDVSFSSVSIDTPDRADVRRDIVPVQMDIQKRRPESPLGRIRDISLRDVSVRSTGTILIRGTPESPIENLSIDNLSFRVAAPAGLDSRSQPSGGERQTTVARDAKLKDRPTHLGSPTCMVLTFIDGLNLWSVRVFPIDEAREQSPRSAFEVFECREVTIDGKREETVNELHELLRTDWPSSLDGRKPGSSREK